MNTDRRAWLLCGAASFSMAVTGCAFVAGSTQQPVAVSVVHNNESLAGVGCTLSNDAGRWQVTSPGTVVVEKHYGDLAVECASGSEWVGRETLVSRSNGLMWGNLLLGHVPGYIIDRGTGAGFDYPAAVAVSVRPVGGAAGAAGGSE